MSEGLALGRRHFLVAAAATATGFLLGVLSETDAIAATPSAESPAGGELSAWILIGPDDTTTIRVTTPEIGNGVMTQFAMTVTEELGCDWSRVRTEYAPTSRDLRENWIYSGASNSLAYFS